VFSWRGGNGGAGQEYSVCRFTAAGKSILPHHPKRKASSVALVEPTYDFIFSSPGAFSPGKDVADLLFTDKFLMTMLNESSQDATLASSK
jgi:hypothetical protein